MSVISSRLPSPVTSISTWATALLLLGTLVLTFAVHYRGDHLLVSACVLLCIIVTAVATVRILLSPRVTRSVLLRWSPAAAGRLLAQLSPVIFLSAAYPLAAGRLSAVAVGGLPFPRLLLATSVTAPWLSQIVCMPLFTALSPHAAGRDPQQLRVRALEAWPCSFAAAIPALAVMAVPVWLTEHWRLSAILVYATLCLLNAVFAQSLVYSVVSRHNLLWLAGWGAYAAALLVIPRVWFAPPLAGLWVQIAYLVWHTRYSPLHVLRPHRIFADLGKGALLGCLLWSDKYLYFLRFPHDFRAGVLFGAMVPAIVAYNFYFALLAPRTDGLVESVRRAMTEAPIPRLRQECSSLSSHIRGSAAQAALLCALLSLLVVSALTLVIPADSLAAGAEMLACWCFVMGALACYKLAYLGHGRLAYGYGALHLALAAAAFTLSPSGPDVYLALAAVELLLVTLVLQVCLRDWDQPEFMLFWRHATQW
ncbi:MAG: hypothetical protein ACLQI7_02575 [Streptosporangiaceae bacterium]